MSITTVAMEIITTQKGGEALIWQARGASSPLAARWYMGRSASSPLAARWYMGRNIGGVLRGFAQLESQQREMKSYSKPMVTIIQWMG